MTEILIALGVIAVLSAILLPIIHHVAPSREVVMAKRAYYTASTVIHEMVNNRACYPDKSQETGAARRLGLEDGYGYENCYWGRDVAKNSIDTEGNAGEKFSTLFMEKLGYTENGAAIDPQAFHTTKSGMSWKVLKNGKKVMVDREIFNDAKCGQDFSSKIDQINFPTGSCPDSCTTTPQISSTSVDRNGSCWRKCKTPYFTLPYDYLDPDCMSSCHIDVRFSRTSQEYTYTEAGFRTIYHYTPYVVATPLEQYCIDYTCFSCEYGKPCSNSAATSCAKSCRRENYEFVGATFVTYSTWTSNTCPQINELDRPYTGCPDINTECPRACTRRFYSDDPYTRTDEYCSNKCATTTTTPGTPVTDPQCCNDAKIAELNSKRQQAKDNYIGCCSSQDKAAKHECCNSIADSSVKSACLASVNGAFSMIKVEEWEDDKFLSVIVDIDGTDKGDNCFAKTCGSGKTPDRFTLFVNYDGRIKVNPEDAWLAKRIKINQKLTKF